MLMSVQPIMGTAQLFVPTLLEVTCAPVPLVMCWMLMAAPVMVKVIILYYCLFKGIFFTRGKWLCNQ